MASFAERMAARQKEAADNLKKKDEELEELRRIAEQNPSNDASEDNSAPADKEEEALPDEDSADADAQDNTNAMSAVSQPTSKPVISAPVDNQDEDSTVLDVDDTVATAPVVIQDEDNDALDEFVTTTIMRKPVSPDDVFEDDATAVSPVTKPVISAPFGNQGKIDDALNEDESAPVVSPVTSAPVPLRSIETPVEGDTSNKENKVTAIPQLDDVRNTLIKMRNVIPTKFSMPVVARLDFINADVSEGQIHEALKRFKTLKHQVSRLRSNAPLLDANKNEYPDNKATFEGLKIKVKEAIKILVTLKNRK